VEVSQSHPGCRTCLLHIMATITAAVVYLQDQGVLLCTVCGKSCTRTGLEQVHNHGGGG
jgi:hypothetical protein